MGHVFARLTGYGQVLVPHWPYRFERHPDGGDALRVTRWTPEGPRHAVIRPGHPVDVDDVVDVTDGLDHRERWSVETSVFRVAWPPGLTVESSHDPGDHTPFYLHDTEGSTIFPQGPVPRALLDDLDTLVAEGQTVLDQRAGDDGIEVVELAYEHDAEQWWQGHWVIGHRQDTRLLVTAQARLRHRARMSAAAATVASGLDPVRGQVEPTTSEV